MNAHQRHACSFTADSIPRPSLQAMSTLLSVELGDRLATLGHGVLRQVAREDQPDRGLDLARAQGVPVVHVDEAGALARDPLEDVSDERVHDEHGLVRDTNVRVDLLKDLEDVGGEGLAPLLVPLLLVLRGGSTLGALDGRLLLGWGL